MYETIHVSSDRRCSSHITVESYTEMSDVICRVISWCHSFHASQTLYDANMRWFIGDLQRLSEKIRWNFDLRLSNRSGRSVRLELGKVQVIYFSWNNDRRFLRPKPWVQKQAWWLSVMWTVWNFRLRTENRRIITCWSSTKPVTTPFLTTALLFGILIDRMLLPVFI